MLNKLKGPGGKRKFSNFLIDRDFQLRYVVWSLLVGVFLLTLFGSISHFFILQTQELIVESLKLGPLEAEELARNFRILLTQLLVGSTLLMLVITWVALVVSHRAAGPLYRFKSVFDEIAKGNRSERIRLRPKDDFQEVASSFNAMMDTLAGESSKRPPQD